MFAYFSVYLNLPQSRRNMCEYSGRSYEVFVNKMLQSCCSLTATHVQCYCDRRAVTLQ